ncbi:MAG: sulfide/dihydroorotate dehydrogenase-like FAD/NAD-binding protein [Elusimicrobia bacterium]|nr:sulfide/dihydroorotate dehydrogenase-like FAD/NAD-binding protein [Elusimicrobiota bacterium]
MEYKPQERYKIVDKIDISDVISKHIIYAPFIASSAKPGNFVILMKDEKSERIPVTLVDFDRVNGTITVIIQSIGKSTAEINLMKKGDSFLNVSGPLGTPVEIKKWGTVVGVGGGVGIAELYPIAKAFKEAGNKVISILGARSKDLLILEDETIKISDEVLITTDDGSSGKKGVVTDAIKELYTRGEKIDAVFTIGPLVMMKFVSLTTKPYNTPTFASLNPIMLDGTGMCGGCRIEIDGQFKFACVDGPMFDAHKVNFDSLMKRNNGFKDFEKQSISEFERTHKCKIGLH